MPDYADNIRKSIRLDILAGKYDGGVRFPSEKSFARRYGVSRSTVTRVLETLKHDGLVASRKGSGTFVCFDRLGGSRRIGLLVPGPESNGFYEGIVKGAVAKCYELGYEPMLRRVVSEDGKIRQRREAAAMAQDFILNHVDGVLLMPFSQSAGEVDVNSTMLSSLRKKGIVVQLVNRTVDSPEARECDLVRIDNVDAGRRLARHLISKKARRCLFLDNGLRSRIESVNLRYIGISAEFGELRLGEIRCFEGTSNDAKKIGRWVRRYRIQAVACATDWIAERCLRSLSECGIRVPQDVLVTGFDGLSARPGSISLTTIKQPLDEIGSVAISRLVDRIRKRSLPQCEIIVNSELVIGGTTGK